MPCRYHYIFTNIL